MEGGGSASPVAMSTISFASWFGSRGRLGLLVRSGMLGRWHADRSGARGAQIDQPPNLRRHRLVAAVDFRRQVVYVKFVGTHREYDAIDPFTISLF
ncbi:MAG: type II toxin-antitoxin system HigB family toxin [Alphaproteobacteria bacterium]